MEISARTSTIKPREGPFWGRISTPVPVKLLKPTILLAEPKEKLPNPKFLHAVKDTYESIIAATI